jgi:hypothetical protein
VANGEKKRVFFRHVLTTARRFAGSQNQNGKQQQSSDEQTMFHEVFLFRFDTQRYFFSFPTQEQLIRI